MRCCLENLISNAIKFYPEGANVRIEVVPGGQTGKFRIEDQGPGIQDNELDSMFLKFTRLGLHIVYELISAMQGSVIHQKSALGGVCFTVKLANRTCLRVGLTSSPSTTRGGFPPHPPRAIRAGLIAVDH